MAPVSIEAEYLQVLERLGLVVRADGPWALVGRTEQMQGWKLHLSTVPSEAVALLQCAASVLSDPEVPFKFTRTTHLLGALNEGRLGDQQVGKFLTVYAPEDRVRDLAERLIRATAGFHGPVVKTDLRLGDVVYTRFGSFNPIIKQDRLGQAYPVIYDCDGLLRRDSYSVPFVTPDGLTNPFADLSMAVGSGAKNRLFGPGYLLLDVLKASAKGSVFLALDLRERSRTGLCVLKQGRQFCMSDELGRDIRDRLRHQSKLSHDLASVVSTPTAGNYFEVDGDGYLHLEYLKGRTLLEELRPCAWVGLEGKERRRLLNLMIGLSDALASMHAAGYVHRDMTPTNVLVGANGSVHLLDLELAHALHDSALPFTTGTPGYMSPEQERLSPPHPAQDVYSFGCLLVTLLCGCEPGRVVGDGSNVAERLTVLSGGANPTLIRIVERCVATSPDTRPAMTEIHSFLVTPEASAVRARMPIEASPRVGLLTVIRSGVRSLLDDTALDDETRLWLSPSDDTDPSTGAHRSFELRRNCHHGVAGVIYTLSRLVRLGFVDVEVVRPRVERAIRWIKEVDRPATLPGLYFGEAGVSVALLEASSSGLAVDERHVRDMLTSSLAAPLDWHDVTHGAAGQGLAAMLGAPIISNQHAALRRLVTYLVENQEEDGSWRVPPGVDGLSGQTLTGFAHGCAGIVYFLSAAAARYEVADAEQAWRRGARWLIRQAEPTGNGTLEWTYSDERPERWMWWCHGAPGIALTFLELYRATGEKEFADTAERALMNHPGDVRSSNLTTCHGLAGLGEIYIEAARILDDSSWLEKAQQVARTLVAFARPAPNGGLTWLVEDPYTPTADLMSGSAGILHFLARLEVEDSGLGFPLLPV